MPIEEKLKFPHIEIDFDELLYLNSWPVKTLVYGLFKKGDVVKTPDGVGTKRTIGEILWKVCDLFLDKWNLDNRTAIRKFIHIANREMNKKDACLFLESSIFPYLKSKAYQPNEKMVELVDRVLGQTEAPSTTKTKPTQPEPETQPKEALEIKPDEECPEITFSRKGDKWEVGIDKTVIINHMVGMSYIEYLLRKPNKRISCISLAQGENKQNSSESEGGATFSAEDSPGVPGSHNDQFYKGKNLDKESYREQRKLVLDLKHDLDKAKDKDPDIDIIRAEYNEQSNILTAMYDKHGNPRDDSAAESKARKNVSRAINRARNKIQEHLPGMSTYLTHIRTGTEVIFSPPDDLKFRVK